MTRLAFYPKSQTLPPSFASFVTLTFKVNHLYHHSCFSPWQLLSDNAALVLGIWAFL